MHSSETTVIIFIYVVSTIFSIIFCIVFHSFCKMYSEPHQNIKCKKNEIEILKNFAHLHGKTESFFSPSFSPFFFVIFICHKRLVGIQRQNFCNLSSNINCLILWLVHNVIFVGFFFFFSLWNNSFTFCECVLGFSFFITFFVHFYFNLAFCFWKWACSYELVFFTPRFCMSVMDLFWLEINEYSCVFVCVWPNSWPLFHNQHTQKKPHKVGPSTKKIFYH